MYATGANESGQLGLGTTNEPINHFKRVPIPFELKVKQVACGWAHAILLTEDFRIFGCGDCKKGQLGKSIDTQSLSAFSEIEIKNEKFIQVACGLYSSFAVTESGKVFFWGQFRSIRSEICWNPILLDQFENVHKIAIGHKHILVLSSDGKVTGFGCNKYGQLSFEQQDAIDIFAGWNHSILRLNPNSFLLIGKNDHNQLAHSDKSCNQNIIHFESEQIVDFAVGSDHSLLLTSKRLLAWGWNEHGILGQDHTNQIYGPPQEISFDIKRIKRVFCGPVSCFLITE